MISLPKTTRPPGRVLRQGQSGFTIVELVVVIILLGILASISLPRFFGTSAFEARGFADTAASAARFAQKMALNSGCDTRFVIAATGAGSGVSGYRINQRADCSSGDFDLLVSRPGGGAWQGETPNGVNLGGDLDVYFDASGRPHLTEDDSLFSTSVQFVVGDHTVVIEPLSGLVYSR